MAEGTKEVVQDDTRDFDGIKMNLSGDSCFVTKLKSQRWGSPVICPYVELRGAVSKLPSCHNENQLQDLAKLHSGEE